MACSPTTPPSFPQEQRSMRRAWNGLRWSPQADLDTVLHSRSCLSLLDGTPFHSHFQSLLLPSVSCFCFHSNPSSSNTSFGFFHALPYLFPPALRPHFANALRRSFLDLLSPIPHLLSLPFLMDGAYSISGGSRTVS